MSLLLLHYLLCNWVLRGFWDIFCLVLGVICCGSVHTFSKLLFCKKNCEKKFFRVNFCSFFLLKIRKKSNFLLRRLLQTHYFFKIHCKTKNYFFSFRLGNLQNFQKARIKSGGAVRKIYHYGLPTGIVVHNYFFKITFLQKKLRKKVFSC